MPAAASEGTTFASPNAVAPVAAPIAAPTTGKSAAPRATSRPSRTTSRPTGMRVRNATAPSEALATGIGYSRILEARHVVEERERTPHDRQCESGTASLAEPQAEVEERLEPERFEHQRVTGLRRAVRRDHR